MLDKAPLGKKYTCFKCGCKFYDLNREEPLCPRCGADQREDPNPDPREAFLEKFRRPTSTPQPARVREEETEMDVDVEEFGDEDFGDGELIDTEIGDEDFGDGEEEEAPEGEDEE